MSNCWRLGRSRCTGLHQSEAESIAAARDAVKQLVTEVPWSKSLLLPFVPRYHEHALNPTFNPWAGVHSACIRNLRRARLSGLGADCMRTGRNAKAE